MQPATEPPDRQVTERRRQAALAGYANDTGAARRALGDDVASVRATALGALERLGALRDEDVAAALGDPAAEVRRRACEIAARRPDVDCSAAISDPDAAVVEMAAWAAGERGDPAAVDALSRLAAPSSGHADPLCREAAVAALGAIGDPSGLPALLAALEDKPAIRRRAALSLAAFSAPEADAGLRRCLGDRDWQVRQIAEDLLADG